MTIDYNGILRANLERVFNERDSSLRLAAVAELFVAEPIMYEPAGIVRGQVDIANTAGQLLEQFGPTFRFTPTRDAVGHHGVGSLPWEAGPEGEAVTVRGSDVAEIRDGKIARLWVMLEPAV